MRGEAQTYTLPHMSATPKSRPVTARQTMALALLRVRLGSQLPRKFHGYLQFLGHGLQPPPVAVPWLARLETVSPGVTAQYQAILRQP